MATQIVSLNALLNFGNSRPTQTKVGIKDLTEVTEDIRTCVMGLLLTYPIMKRM